VGGLGSDRERAGSFDEVRIVDSDAIKHLSLAEIRKSYSFEAIEFLERLGENALGEDLSYELRPSVLSQRTRSKSSRDPR
jgi:hypothetical protein